MNVQRWINAHILSSLNVHHCSYAFKEGSSILKCAARHSGAKWLVKMDVSGFFGSISEIQVYRVFRKLGYQPLISFELARLTTHPSGPNSSRYKMAHWRSHQHAGVIGHYRSAHIGYLPQGAPTSPMLSNVVMREADAEIEKFAKKVGMRYTRYSDDLTFSTTSNSSRAVALSLIQHVSKVLRSMGLEANPRKTVVAPPGSRKIVLGLLVHDNEPRLTRDFRDKLRQHLYYLNSLGPSKHAAARGFDSIWGMYRHIRGLIDFANLVDQSYAETMLKQLHQVKWPIDLSEVTFRKRAAMSS